MTAGWRQTHVSCVSRSITWVHVVLHDPLGINGRLCKADMCRRSTDALTGIQNQHDICIMHNYSMVTSCINGRIAHSFIHSFIIHSSFIHSFIHSSFIHHSFSCQAFGEGRLSRGRGRREVRGKPADHPSRIQLHERYPHIPERYASLRYSIPAVILTMVFLLRRQPRCF
jgi:hypothetical protein